MKDPYAVEQFKELVREFGVKTVVETGTYKGDSTVQFAEIVEKTVSIEIVSEHFTDAVNRFLKEGYDQQGQIESGVVVLTKDKRRVTLIYGSSPEMIARIIGKLEEPILFYLDAHWLEYWPLKDEIRAIKPRPNSLIIVHDVKVPGKDFGYDVWPSGVNEYETFKDDLAYVNPNYRIFYNEKAGGDYRGILYAVPPKWAVQEQKHDPATHSEFIGGTCTCGVGPVCPDCFLCLHCGRMNFDSYKEVRPMKILVISTKIFPVSGEMRYGGIERLVYLISTGLKAQGHQISVAAPEGSHLPSGIEHINTGPLGDFVESERVALATYSYRLKDFDAILDLSHTHWAMIENDLPGLAFIWHDPYIMKPLEPTYNICSLSNWQAHRFQAIYGYEARVLDPHCSSIRPASRAKPSNRFIFIGKMGPDKGCLEAINLCKEAGQSLDIIGAPGPGDPAEYLEQVKAQCNTVAPAHGPVGQITYCGEVPDSTKNYSLTKARALLYPVNYKAPGGEAHSHKMVDALMLGCPCITYNQGAMSEVIENGVTGFLANDKQDFKEAMLKARHLDRATIREIAVKRWSIEATCERILAVAKSVAEGERWGQARTGPVILRPQAPSAVGYVNYTLKEYPRQIRLDTINSCNAHCLPCHYNFQKSRGGKMSNELLIKILNEIKDWGMPLEEIVPVNFGEIFILKNWYQILRLIEEKLPQTRIALPTNGSLLDDGAVRKLASIRTLKWLNFSVNAFFKETYEAFTGLKTETIDRVKRAAELIRSLRPDIVTCASMIFDTSFQTELERDLFIQFWSPLASIVSINPAAYCDSPLRKPIVPVKTACRSIFDGLTVLYDGRVITGCCFDARGELLVGDSNETLVEIWRGKKLKQLCQLHLEGRRAEIELCSKCSFA